MQIARADASLCDLEPLAIRVDATRRSPGKRRSSSSSRRPMESSGPAARTRSAPEGGLSSSSCGRSPSTSRSVRTPHVRKRCGSASSARPMPPRSVRSRASRSPRSYRLGCPLPNARRAALASRRRARGSVPLRDTEGGWLNLTTDELVAAAELAREGVPWDQGQGRKAGCAGGSGATRCAAQGDRPACQLDGGRQSGVHLA